MSETELYETVEKDESSPQPQQGDLYKKWFRIQSLSGFLAIRPWPETGMLSIDIGEVKNGELSSHTNAWVSAFELATYLQAVQNGNGPTLYPTDTKLGVGTEGFAHYGGSTVNKEPVSRILKIDRWDDNDPSSFRWRTGHFKARTSSSGAFIPDMGAVISSNMIKVSRREMAEILFRLTTALNGYAASDLHWVTTINQRKSDD